jgi:hypothetical protein
VSLATGRPFGGKKEKGETKMQKEKIVQDLVEFIESTYEGKKQHYGQADPISLFTWGHALRCYLSNKYDINGDINRILVAQAYNQTHPNTPYQINPITLDNPSLSYENI